MKSDKIKKLEEVGLNGDLELSGVMCVLRNKNHGGYAIDQDGLFVKIKGNHKFGWDPIAGCPCWNLELRLLRDQSDEVIDFVCSLMKE